MMPTSPGAGVSSPVLREHNLALTVKWKGGGKEFEADFCHYRIWRHQKEVGEQVLYLLYSHRVSLLHARK